MKITMPPGVESMKVEVRRSQDGRYMGLVYTLDAKPLPSGYVGASLRPARWYERLWYRLRRLAAPTEDG